MKKIAITGSNGFVGSRLATKLAENGFAVTCLVRPGADISLLAGNANISYVDYQDPDQTQKALNGVNILIHNAGSTRERSWLRYQRANVDLTADLIKAANNTKCIEQFIYISSQAAAGSAASAETPVQESDAAKPVTYYGKSKLLAEKIIQKKCKKSYTIIRPVSVYGEGDKDFLQYFKLVEKHLAFHIGIKTKYLSLIHIDELTDFIAATVLNKLAENEILFAAANYKVSITKFITALEDVIGRKTISIRIPKICLYPMTSVAELFSLFNCKPPILNFDKLHEFKQDYWLVSAGKAEELLNWQPENNLKHNLEKTYHWYRENKWL